MIALFVLFYTLFTNSLLNFNCIELLNFIKQLNVI